MRWGLAEAAEIHLEWVLVPRVSQDSSSAQLASSHIPWDPSHKQYLAAIAGSWRSGWAFPPFFSLDVTSSIFCLAVLLLALLFLFLSQGQNHLNRL